MNIWERAAFYELIAADLRDGIPGYIVAKKHGIAPITVYRIRDHFGITPAPRGLKPKTPPYDPEAARLWQERQAAMNLRRDQIIARFEDGETLAAIGEAFGITRERVRQIVRTAGMRPRLEQGRERRAAIAQQMLDEDMTAKIAAERFGFNPSDAHRIAREFGHVLKAEPRLIDEPRFAEMAEKVRGGMSIRAAAGGDHPTEAALARYCEENGIKSLRGRWRPREERAALVRVMRASRATWAQVAKAVSAVEGYSTGPAAICAWSQFHLSTDEYTPPKRPDKPRAERRSRGVGKGHGPRLPVTVCDEVREAARQNYGKAPASEIAKAHGVTRNVIIGHWFRLRRAGLLPLHDGIYEPARNAAATGDSSGGATIAASGTQSTGNVGGSAGRSHFETSQLPIGSPASVPVDTRYGTAGHTADPGGEGGIANVLPANRMGAWE